MRKAGFGSMSSPSFLLIQLRQIGDVVLTTPIARILKERVPGSRVAFLTEPPSDELLRGNPFIDEILVLKRHAGWKETLALALDLRRRSFDAVLDFMGNPRSALLTFLSGSPVRISRPARARGVVYTHRIPPVGDYGVEMKKQLLRPLGIQSPWNRPEIRLTSEEAGWARRVKAEQFAAGNRRMVTLDPTHRRATRRWPAEYYGILAATMAERLRAVPVVLWGPGEEAVADAVLRASEGKAVKAPPTGLREMAALIAVADLHVGNCSAPRHIAVAVGTPSFTILGSTSGGWTHPAPEHHHVALGLECQPCHSNRCPRDVECLRGLLPELVMDELAGWAEDILGWEAT